MKLTMDKSTESHQSCLMQSLLIDILVFSTAAVVFVPIFRKVGLGAILAYLFAGIIIGPHSLGVIQDPEVILHFSELGIVFLLFIIGLELAPAKLWKLRHSIFGLGLLQVLLTGLIFMGIGVALGLETSEAYIAGFGLALSSTAFGIQLLEESRQLNTTHGQGSFSILMFQDLAVVPILASLALFSSDNGASSADGFSIVKVVLALVAVVLFGRYIISHILRLIADSRTQEVFTALTLLIVIGTALLMEQVGLSMGMGAFFAGVLLANSEYRHELEINLLPFKGLLLGLFFIAVGMSLDLNIIYSKPQWVGLITLGILAIKALIIFILGRVFGFPKESSRNMAFTLPQSGEFAFVIFSTALSYKILDAELANILSAAVTLSMGLTPLLFSLNQKLFRNYSELSERPYDNIKSNEVEVIIAGYGRFGQIVSRFLRSEEVNHTILEHSAAQVDIARKFGSKVYYGDATREDTLKAAGAKLAKVLVLAIDDPESSIKTAKLAKQKFPHLQVIARVRNREHALNLIAIGINSVHRETYLTSLEVAKEVLLFRGSKLEDITRRLEEFRIHDERILRNQLEYRHDEKQFISFTNKANQELQEILKADRES